MNTLNLKSKPIAEFSLNICLKAMATVVVPYAALSDT